MASITLHVPAGLVETIHDEFVRLREIQFDVLESRPARDRSQGQRDAANLLCAIDIALHSVPWDDIRPDQSITLTADGGLLLLIAHGALLRAADRLVAECHRYPAERFDPDQVVASMVADLSMLVELHGQAHAGR